MKRGGRNGDRMELGAGYLSELITSKDFTYLEWLTIFGNIGGEWLDYKVILDARFGMEAGYIHMYDGYVDEEYTSTHVGVITADLSLSISLLPTFAFHFSAGGKFFNVWGTEKDANGEEIIGGAYLGYIGIGVMVPVQSIW